MYKNKLKRKLAIYYKLIGFSFLITLGSMVVLQMVKKDTAYSPAEKRILTDKPKISWNTLKDGTFSSRLESYLKDQTAGRDGWILINTSWKRLMGQNISNGVYRGKKGYLIQKFKSDKATGKKTTSEVLNTFLNEYPNCNSYIMLVPTASEILREYLPPAALTDSEEKWYKNDSKIFNGEQIHKIELIEYFQKQRENNKLYYKTDHHWTSQAAFLAFQKLAEEMGIDVAEKDWDKITVTDTFQGLLMSKSGFYSSVIDSIDVYNYAKEEVKVLVNYVDEQKTTASIYDEEGLKGEDPYEVFLGGNFPRIRIETESGSQKKLLLFKDSYANCFIPFLLPYFSEIDVVDARYYADNIYKQMEASKYTDLLVLYNIDTYSNDTALKMVLQGDMK